MFAASVSRKIQFSDKFQSGASTESLVPKRCTVNTSSRQYTTHFAQLRWKGGTETLRSLKRANPALALKHQGRSTLTDGTVPHGHIIVA